MRSSQTTRCFVIESWKSRKYKATYNILTTLLQEITQHERLKRVLVYSLESRGDKYYKAALEFPPPVRKTPFTQIIMTSRRRCLSPCRVKKIWRRNAADAKGKNVIGSGKRPGSRLGKNWYDSFSCYFFTAETFSEAVRNLAFERILKDVCALNQSDGPI